MLKACLPVGPWKPLPSRCISSRPTTYQSIFRRECSKNSAFPPRWEQASHKSGHKHSRPTSGQRGHPATDSVRDCLLFLRHPAISYRSSTSASVCRRAATDDAATDDAASGGAATDDAATDGAATGGAATGGTATPCCWYKLPITLTCYVFQNVNG